MSFGTCARQVRDERLPAGLRYLALRAAVERYSPIGFMATWSFLAGHDDERREDPDTFPRMLDVLETSRRCWLREIAAYAERRKVEKRFGLLPRADEWRYRFGFRWPGPDAHEVSQSTVSALWARHRRIRVPASFPGHPEVWSTLAAGVAECVESYLAAPEQPYVENPYLLRICAKDVNRLPSSYGWDEPGLSDYRQRLIKLVELVAHDVLPLIRRGGVSDVIDPELDVWVAEINGHVVGLVDAPNR